MIPVKKKYFLGMAAVLAAVVILGIIVLNSQRNAKKEQPRMAVAEKKDVVDSIQFRGTVVAARKVPISAEASGQVVKLYVRQGERVEKGAPLLEIDPTQLSSKVDRQKLMVEKSQVTFANSEKELARAEELFRENLITESQLEDFKKTKDLARLDSALAKKELDALNQQLGKVVIKAPISGIVTAKNVEEGEVVVSTVEVSAGKILLVITEDARKGIEALVSDVERAVLKMDQSVSVWLDVNARKRYAAKIAKMDSAAVQADGTKQADSSKTGQSQFRIEVEILGGQEDFILGSNATIEAVLHAARDVVSIPIEALFRQDEEAWVYVVKGAKFEKRTVEAGTSSVDRVEIKQGLSSGEKVLLEEPPAE